MLRLACLLVISSLLGPALQAQPAFLVEDINPGLGSPSWPHETEWVAFGDLAVFTRADLVHGVEIWKSDGTAAGTSPILDICPGICSSNPRSLAVVGSMVFFHADDGVHGGSLWKSDGTAAGTTLVREVSPFNTIALGGLLLFQHYSAGSLELWRSDGTRQGTYPVWGFGPNADSSNPWLGYAGGVLLFSFNGRELWKTDGTSVGTSFIKSMELWAQPVTGGPYPSIGGRLFFLSGSYLWVSDGTLAGTSQVADVNVWSDPEGLSSTLTALGNEIFFAGNAVQNSAESSRGYELWKSDGTAAGTVQVKDLNPGTPSSYPTEIVAAGDHVFFRTLISPKLWKSDGTAAGTVPIEPGVALGFKHGYNGFQALGEKLVFFASADGTGHEPWVSDGTGAGTLRLADIYPGIGSSFDNGGWYGPDGYPLSQWDGGVVAGGQWIFRAQTPSGWTAWKSDGTPAGTELIENDNGGAYSAVQNMVDLDGTLIFTASEDGERNDLWRSDGSAPGTSRIDAPTFTDPPRYLTRFGGHVYFTSSGRLWRTEGAAPEIFDNEWWILYLQAAGPHLFYVKAPGNGGVHSLEATDGTAINQILSTGAWNFGHLTAAGTNLFFAHRPYPVGEELWKSAGASNDAVMLRRFPYMWPPQLGSIAGLGNSVFFAANDGSTGRELWFSDGTVAGTRLVKDIVPGAGSSDPRSIVAAGNLAFFVADDGVAGAELWRTDGTASGTFRVKDIHPGFRPSWIRGITAYGDRVLFAADDGVHGVELWISDGTEAGTVLVEDIRPGAGSSHPGDFQVIGHVVLFAADDGEHGLEPWRTDGAAPGTFLIQDVFTGAEPSSPSGFTLSGDYVYFTATDHTHGFELWALGRAALGPALSAAKRVLGPAFPGGTVTFEIEVTNSGAALQPDNPGDEMVDLLPAPLSLTGASTDSGAVTVNLAQNRVAWNGALAPGESATITIEAAIPSSTEYQTFFNQATLSFDADGEGTNDSAGVSDDPGRAGSRQATAVVISTPALDFHTATPCRVLDTRTSTPLSAGVPRTVTFAGSCGIPASAKAVAANLTVLGATGAGNLVVYPTGTPVPGTSSASFSAGQVRANSAQLPLAGGQANARATVLGGGTVHLIVDVTGYYE